ncbi:transposase [Pseudomonadota bacterium]
MPRRTRMYISGLPCHVIQRGNNREACFIEPENHLFYLEFWRGISRRYGVVVCAYCLMTNHIHFLATPSKESLLSDTMKVGGGRYAQYMNKKYHRTGTLLEGRHRSSLIQQDRYLLTCCRIIELKPVRAVMVSRPEEYAWSSYGTNAWGDSSWTVPHQAHLHLGDNSKRRYYAYRELFKTELSEEDLPRIRKAAHY